MTQREKLVELFNKAEDEHYASFVTDDEHYVDFYEFLADYLLENGVIVPPCKVGDTIYVAYPKQGIVERKVKRFQIGKYGFLVIVCGEGIDVGLLGKHYFLTKEEAEKALAEKEE